MRSFIALNLFPLLYYSNNLYINSISSRNSTDQLLQTAIHQISFEAHFFVPISAPSLPSRSLYTWILFAHLLPHLHPFFYSDLLIFQKRTFIIYSRTCDFLSSPLLTSSFQLLSLPIIHHQAYRTQSSIPYCSCILSIKIFSLFLLMTLRLQMSCSIFFSSFFICFPNTDF